MNKAFSIHYTTLGRPPPLGGWGGHLVNNMVSPKSFSSHLKHVRRTPSIYTVNRGRSIFRQKVIKFLKDRLGNDVTGVIVKLLGNPGMTAAKYSAWVKLNHAISARRVQYQKTKQVRGYRRRV